MRPSNGATSMPSSHWPILTSSISLASGSWKAAALPRHAGIRSWWESMLGIAPDFSTEVEDVRDLGDITVARAHIRGHGIASGASMEQTLSQVAEWRQKKCARRRTFASEAEALEAAGLRE